MAAPVIVGGGVGPNPAAEASHLTGNGSVECGQLMTCSFGNG